MEARGSAHPLASFKREIVPKPLMGGQGLPCLPGLQWPPALAFCFNITSLVTWGGKVSIARDGLRGEGRFAELC